MSDLASHIFDIACSMNRAKAAELQAEVNQEIAPYIAKIPLRAELRALEQAADAYQAQARLKQAEADRLWKLAQQAREQAKNLAKCANL